MNGTDTLTIPAARVAASDDIALFSSLQMRWSTSLSGRVERNLAEQPLDLEAAIVTAWHETVDDAPEVRAELDRLAANPTNELMAHAIAKAIAKEHLMFAVASGKAAVSDVNAVAIGARIVGHARATYVPGAAVIPPVECKSFLQRLRDAVA